MSLASEIIRRIFVEFLGVFGTIALGCFLGGFFFKKDKLMQDYVQKGIMKQKTLEWMSYGFFIIGVVLALVQIYINYS